MPTTPASIVIDAGVLYTGLTADLDIDLDLPALVLDTNWEVPPSTDLPTLAPLTVADLTSGVAVGGTGVFDELMKTINAHLTEQFAKNRITGSDYAKVYLGSVSSAIQFSIQFLLGKDRAYLENLQIIETINLARAQVIRAMADVQLANAQIQIAQFQAIEMRLKAYTARNQYAASKMDLVLGYNNILEAESKQLLTNAQYQLAYAQTHSLMPDGSALGGIVAAELLGKEKQAVLIGEQYELARSEIRDTLSSGGAFAGMQAIKKLTLEAQRLLTEEQVDTQRAQTKDTLRAGGAISGLAAVEKLLKTEQKKLIAEQYESQRGQTRATLSTGETIVGLTGSQVRLYDQQIISYKRDAESKGVKMIMDSWIARKTIDDGVAVPVAIDVPAIETLITTFRGNLDL